MHLFRGKAIKIFMHKTLFADASNHDQRLRTINKRYYRKRRRNRVISINDDISNNITSIDDENTINISNLLPQRKRRRLCARDDCLNHFDSTVNRPLHLQSFVKEQIKQFHCCQKR